jgi:hypothetical protein
MTDQTAMFSKEQQTGSGQSNMLDLINHNEDRKTVLRNTTHTVYNDPSHAWIEVEYNDLKVLGILGAVTGFSYRKGNTVYLEEDLDAVTYIKALFGSFESPEYFNWKDNHIVEDYVDQDSFIRNLHQFYR